MPPSFSIIPAPADGTGEIMLIISGGDVTAWEFEEVAEASPDWSHALSPGRALRYDLKASDHTFSRKEWSYAVMKWTIDWVAGLK